ncbi:hypothetical protein [Runella sp.]|uniref:hypothetical protein n=1 Tax=Runella sp. TaxID=1960881 RepID=UPI0026021949|nr:hypothetical protein [Runella sp.]
MSPYFSCRSGGPFAQEKYRNGEPSKEGQSHRRSDCPKLLRTNPTRSAAADRHAGQAFPARKDLTIS